MNWIKKVLEFIRRLFAGDIAAKICAGIDAAAPYVLAAYEVASFAARMTPTRSDDEVLSLARELGVLNLFEPSSDKGICIGNIVFAALRRKYPDATDRALRRAIEIAYGALRP